MSILKPRLLSALAVLSAVMAAAAFGQSPATSPHDDEDVVIEIAPEPAEVDPVKILLEEVRRLREELFRARNDLAAARMQAEQATRELEEMRQFMNDHDRYGRDFKQYRDIKEIAEREARQRQAQATREQREAERLHRQARAEAARQARQVQNAETNELARYRRMGFTPVGLDVYAGKMAFFYGGKDGAQSQIRIDYDPVLGDYLRPIETPRLIDYSTMTISGSVLNGSDQVRNIGVAITFFDNNGNQVGHEIVKVNNARPNVPYPFTSKINMALNRAFDSSSIYILYADPIEDEQAPGDSSTTTQGTTPPPAQEQPYR